MQKDMLYGFFVSLLLIVGCGSADDASVEPGVIETTVVDQLFVGGALFDGSGSAPVVSDVGITDGVISFIGDAVSENVTSEDSIDISGYWIAPGFIDAHSHVKLDPDFGRDAVPFLTQGITTVVLGVDGDGSSDVAERLNLWRENGIGTNATLYVGHGHVRSEVMGMDDREPTAEELDAMSALVRKGMDEGAFGFSTGLFYTPGSYSSTDEVIALAKVAAEYEGAIYDTHDRDLGAVYEGVGYDASVEEGIRITEESGLRGIFSHYNLQGAHNYGRADIGAKLINDARERGVDIWAAHHPYTATQSNLRAYTIPYWASAGGQEDMVDRFNDEETSNEIAEATNAMLEIRGGADKILIVEPDPDLNGKTLAQVAAERELDPAAAVQDLLRTGNKSVMNLELYDDNNTLRLAQEAWMMTCTDGATPVPDQPITHPRAFGAFPKKMRMVHFDQPLLAPETVIRGFSGLAADFLRLPDRGYLREGYVADVVVIDPENYRDHATFSDPRRLSTGVVHILVNGEFAIRYGETTGALAGLPLTRTGHPAK